MLYNITTDICAQNVFANVFLHGLKVCARTVKPQRTHCVCTCVCTRVCVCVSLRYMRGLLYVSLATILFLLPSSVPVLVVFIYCSPSP